MKNIIYLLGAGTSIEAGMPSSSEITASVLTETNIGKHGGIYYLGHYVSEEGISQDKAQQKNQIYCLQVLLRTIKAMAEATFNFIPERKVSYEDLYYILDQCDQHLRGFEVNPLITRSQRYLEAEMARFCKEKNVNSEKWLLENISEAKKLIRSAIYQLLDKKAGNLNYLDSILWPVIGNNNPACTIFTLNHDSVLEQYLNQHAIEYYDGFATLEKALDDFNKEKAILLWDSLEKNMGSENRVKYFKLHGSINWHFNGKEWFQFQDEEDDVCTRARMDMLLTDTGIALGTHNKYRYYSWSIYSDLQTIFRQALREATHIIIAGFSFTDSLVSNMIQKWMKDNEDRKMLVIDPYAKAIIESRYHSQRQNMDKWIKSGRVILSENIISAVQKDEIRNFIGD